MNNGQLEEWIEWARQDAKSWIVRDRREVSPKTLCFFVSLSIQTVLRRFVLDEDRALAEPALYGNVSYRLVQEGWLP